MAYIRDEYYIYSDGDNIHFHVDHMPMEVFDELVVMRFAQLTLDPEELLTTCARAIEKHQGNFGCDVLCTTFGSPTTHERIIGALRERENPAP